MSSPLTSNFVNAQFTYGAFTQNPIQDRTVVRLWKEGFSMPHDLHRLVYYSRNLVPGTPSNIAAEIESILAASQRNNSRVAVTGALIFNSGVFAQVLEGGIRDIEATFERIQQDERHGEVQVLAFEPAESRGFPSWSMAFVGRSVEAQDLFSHIEETSGYDAKRMEGERIFRIMCDIAVDEERRAA